MADHNLYGVAVGQVWADNDRRSEGRHVLVVGWTDFPLGETSKPRKALVTLCGPAGTVIRDGRGREKRTAIRLDRFRPTSTGYRLVTTVGGER